MESGTNTPPNEFDSPHINAPVWPWSVAGWAAAGILTLLFLLKWLYA